MKRIIVVALLLVIGAGVVAALPGVRSAEAAPPNPFIGEWKAISPHPPLVDAHLSISGGRRIVGMHLTDPYDFLFCASTPGPGGTEIAVEAWGIGLVSGNHLNAVFFYRCSDGTTGFGSATWCMCGTSTDAMNDDTGHLWTRVS